MGDYSNTLVNRVSTGGGVTTFTMTAATVIDTTSRPCKEVYIQAPHANSEPCMVAIGTAVSSIAGIQIPKAVSSAVMSASTAGWLAIPIDDLNRLSFYGGNSGDTVVVMWRL